MPQPPGRPNKDRVKASVHFERDQIDTIDQLRAPHPTITRSDAIRVALGTSLDGLSSRAAVTTALAAFAAERAK